MTIQTTEIVKQYRGGVTALDRVSLEIGTGIFGLLGKNGSGKTTLLRILTTLLEPTSGTVTILGMKMDKAHQRAIKQNLGYLPQEFGFYSEFTVREILEYLCLLRGIAKPRQTAAIQSALESVNLTANGKKKYKQLSGGMKRRMGLAQAMLGDPPILIVDEPTAGVDPEERLNIRKLLSAYAEDHTVLFSTHIIEDVETTCKQLAILEGGSLLFVGGVDGLLRLMTGRISERVFDSFTEFQEFERQQKAVSFKRSGSKIIAVVIDDSEANINGSPYQPTLAEAAACLTMEGNVPHERN